MKRSPEISEASKKMFNFPTGSAVYKEVHQSLLTEKKKPAGDFEFKQIIDSIADCSCLCVRSLVDIYESWVGNFEALQFRKSWQQSFDFGASISKNKVGSKTRNVCVIQFQTFETL